MHYAAGRWPVLLAYLLSFVNLGIYWNNHHHHLVGAASRVNGHVLWANLHLLFWLSLVPFTTLWMSERGFATVPTAVYGLVLLLAALSFFLLQRALMGAQRSDQRIRTAVGRNLKGRLSPLLYLGGIALSFVDSRLGLALYVAVAVMRFVPDRRFEQERTDGAEDSAPTRSADG